MILLKNLKILVTLFSIILLSGCSKKEDTSTPIDPVPQIDYTSIFLGNFLVYDSGYYNVLTTGGGYPNCTTNRVINRLHSSSITADSTNRRSIYISNYFGDSTIYGYAGVQLSLNEIVFSNLPKIKFYTSPCYIAPYPISIPNEPDSSYYYLGLNGKPSGNISSGNDTITVTYTYNGQPYAVGAYYVTINSYFKSTMIRQ